MKRALALLILPLLCACPHRAGTPLQGPVDGPALWARLRAAHDKPDALSEEARIFVDAPKNGGKYTLQLSVKRPSSLRIEALTPLGDPAAVLVTDKGRLALFDLRHKEFYRGPSSPQNLSRLFPVPLRDDELVSLFLGDVPELPGAELESAVREGDTVRLAFAAPGARQDVWVNDSDLRILRVSRSTAAGADPLWTVLLEDHDDKSGVQLPRIIRLKVPSQQISLELRVREMLVGKPPPFGAFALQPPEGVRVIELD
jgi:hypothetical protein